MAQQCGPVFITGTIDDVCFYRMDGKYYVRMKSSLTRKRVMKDPAFRRTREHAALLGTASKIASRVYRLITGERRKHALYREMTGKAIYLLREGRDTEAAFLCLRNQYLEPEEVAHEPYKKEVVKGQKPCGMMRIETPVPELKQIMDFPLLRVRRRKRRLRHVPPIRYS